MTLEILLQKKDRKMQPNSCLSVSVLCSSWPGETPKLFTGSSPLPPAEVDVCFAWAWLWAGLPSCPMSEDHIYLRCGCAWGLATAWRLGPPKQRLLKELCGGTQICRLVVLEVGLAGQLFHFCREFLLRITCWTCGMLLCPLSVKILELFQLALDISTTWKERDSKPQPWKLNTSGLWRRLVLDFHSGAQHELELSLKSPSSIHAHEPAPLPVVQVYEPVSSTAFSVYSKLDQIVLGLVFWEKTQAFNSK